MQPLSPLPPDDITDLLVAYSLDALEPEEMGRVSRMLDEQPELRALLADLRNSVGKLPYGLPESAPPPALRQRTLDYAVGRTTRGPAAAAPAPDLAARARAWLWALGGLAAVAVALLALTFGQLTTVRGQLDAAQQALATAETGSRQVQAVLAQPVRLAELSGSGGRATVIQNANGDMLLAAQLPPLAEDKVYQLWVISGQNAPVGAGVFRVGSDGSGLLSLGPGLPLAGVTLAVTLEPGPAGSPGPTSDVLIAGKI
jgi:anti-sigma-K factor RskA